MRLFQKKTGRFGVALAGAVTGTHGTWDLWVSLQAGRTGRGCEGNGGEHPEIVLRLVLQDVQATLSNADVHKFSVRAQLALVRRSVHFILLCYHMVSRHVPLIGLIPITMRFNKTPGPNARLELILAVPI